MKYVKPRSLKAAVEVLVADPNARCIAGGMTLIAMMNAELVTPTTLVGLRQIPNLVGTEVERNGFRIGALTTHAMLAADSRMVGAAAVIRSAAGQIAHAPIRNRGTIGGAVCHGDPAADLPTALVAANATLEIFGPAGTRTLSAKQFFKTYLQTALEASELVSAVFVPRGHPSTRSCYLKFARADGDYATVSVAVVLSEERGRCTEARVAVGAVGPVPLQVDVADSLLVGSTLDSDAIKRAGKVLADASDPIDDVRGSAEYRRLLIPRLLARVIAAARAPENIDG